MKPTGHMAPAHHMPLWIACLPSRPQPHPVAAALATFAPTVAALEDGWVADLTRTQRLFGGRTALLQRLRTRVIPLGWERLGAAPTPLAALALARSTPADGGVRHALPPRWPAALDALPIETLWAARAHAQTLQALGLRTLGALRAVGDGLALRTDPGLPRSLRQCYGEEPLALAAWQAPPAWHGEQALPGPTTEADALTFAAQRLLQTMQAWLQARQLGVLRWALGWPGQEQAIVIAQREPVQDAARLLRLLRERLARLTLPAPVEAVRLHTLQLAPWRPACASLLHGRSNAADGDPSWPAVLERLAARLGPQRVQRAQLAASWQVRAASRWQAADAEDDPATGNTTPPPPDAAWQPPWWLPDGRALATDARGHPLLHGRPLRCLHGPLQRRDDERGASLQACLVLDAQGWPWWIERTGRGPWHLHGLYA